MTGIVSQLLPIIITIALALIAWWVTEKFSPDELITKIVKVIIFVVVLYVVITKLLGIH